MRYICPELEFTWNCGGLITPQSFCLSGSVNRINWRCTTHQFFTVTQYGSWQQSVYFIYLQAFQFTDMCIQWLQLPLIINDQCKTCPFLVHPLTCILYSTHCPTLLHLVYTWIEWSTSLRVSFDNSFVISITWLLNRLFEQSGLQI